MPPHLLNLTGMFWEVFSIQTNGPWSRKRKRKHFQSCSADGSLKPCSKPSETLLSLARVQRSSQSSMSQGGSPVAGGVALLERHDLLHVFTTWLSCGLFWLQDVCASLQGRLKLGSCIQQLCISRAEGMSSAAKNTTRGVWSFPIAQRI